MNHVRVPFAFLFAFGGLLLGCKLRTNQVRVIDWKGFEKQQSPFRATDQEGVLKLDSLFKKLNPRKGLKVIDYGIYHGQVTSRFLRKEAQILGLYWNLLEVPSPENRFPLPWPETFPGSLMIQNWQPGKIPLQSFDLIVIQGRVDELSPAFPQIATQHCNTHGGILIMNYQHLPQLGEAYCQGNTITKPFLEEMESKGFKQSWEMKFPGLHYLYFQKDAIN